MVITALDKNNINKERQLLPAQLPKGRRGQYGCFYITAHFLKGISTKTNVILNKTVFPFCFTQCHAFPVKGLCIAAWSSNCDSLEYCLLFGVSKT